MSGRIKWTEDRIARLVAEGRGRGTGPDYRPWIQVADISSHGRSRRVWSPKTRRTHHLLSDVEYNLFLALEWARDVTDIREQYPLDRIVTQHVAHECGIPHPHYPSTNVCTVMTVDFMVTRVCGGRVFEEAFNAKRSEEADDERSIAKLEIQRRAMALLDTPHHVVFHSDLPIQKIKNIDWIRDSLVKDGELEPRPDFWSDMSARLANELAQQTQPGSRKLNLADYCATFDGRHGLQAGSGLRAARILMYDRTIQVDLSRPELQTMPVASLVINQQSGQRFATGVA